MLTFHNTQLSKTNGENRGVNKITTELPYPPILPFFNLHTGPFSSTHTPLCLPQRTKIYLANKRKNQHHKENFLRLHGLRAPHPPSYTLPVLNRSRTLLRGLSNDIGIGCAYAEHAELHQKTFTRWAYQSRAHVQTFSFRKITGKALCMTIGRVCQAHWRIPTLARRNKGYFLFL